MYIKNTDSDGLVPAPHVHPRVNSSNPTVIRVRWSIDCMHHPSEQPREHVQRLGCVLGLIEWIAPASAGCVVYIMLCGWHPFQVSWERVCKWVTLRRRVRQSPLHTSSYIGFDDLLEQKIVALSYLSVAFPLSITMSHLTAFRTKRTLPCSEGIFYTITWAHLKRKRYAFVCSLSFVFLVLDFTFWHDKNTVPLSDGCVVITIGLHIVSRLRNAPLLALIPCFRACVLTIACRSAQMPKTLSEEYSTKTQTRAGQSRRCRESVSVVVLCRRTRVRLCRPTALFRPRDPQIMQHPWLGDAASDNKSLQKQHERLKKFQVRAHTSNPHAHTRAYTQRSSQTNPHAAINIDMFATQHLRRLRKVSFAVLAATRASKKVQFTKSESEDSKTIPMWDPKCHCNAL